MEVPPVLLLPAAASDQTGCPLLHSWGHMLLWTALLFLAPAAGTPGLPKAVVSLQPPWLQVFPEDNVTLSCQGARSPGDSSTQWFHNGTAIPTQAQPSYSFKASSSHSGDYRCRTGQTGLSDPVHLDVTSAWLLLQTPRLLVPPGDPIVLRCHSWRNWRLYKITFFQDGKPKWFSHTNSSFSIPHANASHSGAYHCSGFLGQTLHASQSVSITVPGGSPAQVARVSSKPFLPVVIAAVMASVVAVAGAAGVAWVCFRRHQSSANIAGADEAAKAEVENAITYSLLLQPDAPEEDTSPSDYQNM
ncbi:low affinity immunoglobulin gamma Fc region receptor II-b isoform X3 [Eptesicus fuscus]|uniref:low affinity immunoglobulin gamma Fc region receptor II-b isoform X3 n=1 Tax=Eptesicus fuscus TaxID=29078 RepID=UPI002404787F|nr:low affinity immunoglobulin gamma Fc region receptor II-b isoform X3 [Eptesicus fuscus]